MHCKNIAYTTLNSPNNSKFLKFILDASIQFHLFIKVLVSNKNYRYSVKYLFTTIATL